MCLRMPQTPEYIIDSEDDDDDTRSIETFSTTATVDDNPGTGRVLDKYFYHGLEILPCTSAVQDTLQEPCCQEGLC